MLHIPRQVSILSNSYKCIYNKNAIISKVNYCDKKKVLKVLEKTTKDKTSAKNSAANTEVEALSFANDEEILQTVITEKEKDASVRSRLSKECSTLIDKRMKLGSTGLNLHLQDTTKNTCWEDYMFENTIDSLKHPLIPAISPLVETVGVAEGISRPPKHPNGDGGSIGVGNRITRRDPPKVLFAFIPLEWFQFFIPKTGVTGFGTFLFTFGIFLVSKEYYVLEHNYYNGLGMFVLVWGCIKYVGPHIAKYLDKEIDDYEKAWEKGREQTKKMLQEQIEDENLMQFQAEGQTMLIEAKRENVHLQLEEEFRSRQMMVHREVLNRLNYHVAVAKVYKRVFHQNLVDYVTKQVRKSITPELEKDMINISISNLVHELEKK